MNLKNLGSVLTFFLHHQAVYVGQAIDAEVFASWIYVH